MKKYLVVVLMVVLQFSSSSHSSEVFSVKLFHKDSPMSPWYNESKTQEETILEYARQSVLINNSTDSESDPFAALKTSLIPNFAYLMKFNIGDPTFEVVAYADTGSDLTWIQCQPCTHCFNQIQPIYDPTNSKSYSGGLYCNSSSCLSLKSDRECVPDDPIDTPYYPEPLVCGYHVKYVDGSSSRGLFVEEKFTFTKSWRGDQVSFDEITFGCGRDNHLGPKENQSTGIVGLSASPVSIISQLGDKIDQRFSYCLPLFLKDSDEMGVLNFGKHESHVMPENVITAVMNSTILSQVGLYVLTLNQIKIGNKSISIEAGKGDVLVDSGSHLTRIRPDLFPAFKILMEDSIGLVPEPNPEYPFHLCYNTSYPWFDIPFVSFVFEGVNGTSGEYKLSPSNMFSEVRSNYWCMAAVPSSVTTHSTLGNVAQTNHMLEFDLKAQTVAFDPWYCAHY